MRFHILAKFLGISAWNHNTSVQVSHLTFPYHQKILPPQKASTLKWLIYRHSKLSETLLSIFDHLYLVQHQKRTRKSVALLPDHRTKQLLWDYETAGGFIAKTGTTGIRTNRTNAICHNNRPVHPKSNRQKHDGQRAAGACSLPEQEYEHAFGRENYVVWPTLHGQELIIDNSCN